MATYHLELRSRSGQRFYVDVPRTATVQNVINAVYPQLKQHFSPFVKVKSIFHNGRILQPQRRLNDNTSFNPDRWFGLELEDPSAAVRMYMNNPNRRLEGARYRNRMNRRETLRRARKSLPANILNYEIAPMMGVQPFQLNPRRLNGGKRRQTRRRR